MEESKKVVGEMIMMMMMETMMHFATVRKEERVRNGLQRPRKAPDVDIKEWNKSKPIAVP